MRKLILWQNACLVSLFFISGISFSQVPETDISNGIIQAKIYPPDQNKGYYQGTRFDWSGVIVELSFKGHSYFGKWFEKYDPKTHDAITGPVEAFDPMGFEEAKPGETFVKIGVGNLIRPDDKAYRFTVPYEMEDYGKWTVKKKKYQIEFVHELTDASGYSYVYRKNLKLVKGKPELILEHTLENTGKKTIETQVYNHNFFMIDNQKIGPDYSVTFPFNLTIKDNSRGIGDLVELRDNKMEFLRGINQGEHVMLFLEGFNQDAKDYDITIENSKTGAGVRITSDQPMSSLAFWSIPTTLCPEPYQNIVVEPGQTTSWNIKYEFFIEEDR